MDIGSTWVNDRALHHAHWFEHWLDLESLRSKTLFAPLSVGRRIMSAIERGRERHTAFNSVNHESVTWNEIRRNSDPIPRATIPSFHPLPPHMKRAIDDPPPHRTESNYLAFCPSNHGRKPPQGEANGANFPAVKTSRSSYYVAESLWATRNG